MRYKKIGRVIWVLIIAFIFVIAAGRSTLEWRMRDLIYQKSYPVDSRIVIVGIDEETLQFCGRWPFDRTYYDQLIQVLSRGNPLAYFIDVIFAESTDSDDLFSNQIKDKPVLLPTYGILEPTSTGKIDVQKWIFPVDELCVNGIKAHINIVPDEDGIMRMGLTTLKKENEQMISASEWMAGQVMENAKVPQRVLDDLGRFYIHFSGLPGSMPYVPFQAVLNGEVPPEYFEDKLVLIGPYAVGIGDYFNTAIDHQLPMFGVEIHANMLNQMLHEKYTVELSMWLSLLVVFFLMGSFLIVLERFKPFGSTLLLVAYALVYTVVIIALRECGYFLPMLPVFMGLVVCYFYSLIAKYLVEYKERKRIVAMFSRYVAPQVVDEVIRQRESLHLGGVRRDIAVLFVDIRGFTPLSESAEPEEVVEILNAYLTLCATSIFKCGGTLDKFIGDAAMAIFNAPLDQSDFVYKAVEAAYLMKLGAKSLAEELEKQFHKEVAFGIGVHTGAAVIGNIGADFRMDYTAIGDTVNTAARLESNAKSGQILISEAVYRCIENRVCVTELGPYQVKGKSEHILVYQVDGLKEGGTHE